MARAWNPASILSPDLPDFNYSLLVLNQPIDHSLYVRLKHRAIQVVCADGGANRVFDADSKYKPEDLAPSFICGDLDSLRPEVAEAFAKARTEIIKDEDQYATDFIKSLRVINAKGNTEGESLDVIVLGGLGGRADQAFSQLHHLYTVSIDRTLDRIGQIYLVTPESIIFLLKMGFNRIETPIENGHITENVGIIPLGMPSTITTKGLEWDVTDWETSFGTQISTSNHIRAMHVEVMTTERVLFTVEIASNCKNAKEA